MPAAATDDPPELRRVLGSGSIMALVVGGVIGSGIFILPGLMAAQVPSPGLVLVVFLAGGLVSLFGALTFAELGGMFPRQGGVYTYLRTAFGPGAGFLYGWVMFWVIETGLIAAVALAFGRFAGVLFGWDSGLASAVAALVCIWTLTAINAAGVRQGALVQNLFTLAKVGALVLLVAVSFLLARPEHEVFGTFIPEGFGGFSLVGVVAIMALAGIFAYDGWFNVTFAAGEAKNPQRDLPVGLGLGMLAVALVYGVTVLAYFWVLPVDQVAAVGADGNSRIAAAAARATLGAVGAAAVAAAVMVSTFGAVNSVVLAGPRLYNALARDGLFWHPFAKVHPRVRTPVVALVFQGEWASLIVILSVPLPDAYLGIINGVVFAIWLFNILAVGAYFRLRRTMPDAVRPYRTLGHPVVPLVFLAAAVFICANAVVADVRLVLEHGLGRETWTGLTSFWALLLMAAGLPFVGRMRRPFGPPAEPAPAPA